MKRKLWKEKQMLMLRTSQRLLTAALAVCSSASSAALINFVDLVDGRPLVTTDLPFAQITNTFEATRVDALVQIGATGGLPIALGTRAVVLLEPPGDFNQPYSDLLTLTADKEPVTTNTGVFQQIHLTFLSDSTGPITLPTDVPVQFIDELNVLQDVTNQLNLDPTVLQVGMLSDLGGPEVPEPSTVILFGLGLAGLAAFRLRKV